MHLTGICPEGTRRDLLSLAWVKHQSEPKRPASDVTVISIVFCLLAVISNRI